jgi:hypothetical protein
MNDRLLQTLTAADPARDVPVAPGDVEALLRLASHDVTSYDLRPPVRRRRLLATAAAIVAVAAVTGTTAAVVLRGGAPAGPGVPQTSVPTSVAPGCLERIAGGIRPAPYDTAKGRYEYLRRSELVGSSTQMQNGEFAEVRYEVEISTWTATDGAQRRRVVTGAATFADEAARVFYRDNPAMMPAAGTETFDLPPGDVDRTELPAPEPAAMADRVYQPRENGPSQAIVGAGGLTRARVLPAAHRAALLRFLAGTPGVGCAGEQTDPVGRTGVVVSAPIGAGPHPSPGNLGAEAVLLDPATGEILAAGTAGAGGIVWGSVFLERGFTDTRPPLTN